MGIIKVPARARRIPAVTAVVPAGNTEIDFKKAIQGGGQAATPSSIDQIFANPVVQQIILTMGQKLLERPAQAAQQRPKTMNEMLDEMEGRTGVF